MIQLKLVEADDALFYPETESDLTILKHLTQGLVAVNQYGLESLVYPIAALHYTAVKVVPLPVEIVE